MYLKVKEKFITATRLRRLACAALAIICFAPKTSLASNSDWLSFDLNMRQNVFFDQDPGSMIMREHAQNYFFDDVNLSVTVTQSVRAMMSSSQNSAADHLAEGLLASTPTEAKVWVSELPLYRVVEQKEHSYFECALNVVESTISCDGGSQLAVRTGTSDQAPQEMVYDEKLVSQMIHRNDSSPQSLEPQDAANQTTPELTEIVLVPASQGLLSVEGGRILFSRQGLKMSVRASDSVKSSDWSVFVRDSSIIEWSASDRTLISKNPGDTEMFVVTPGRISIIPIQVGPTIQNKKKPNPPVGLAVAQVAPGLASLDGLDRAAAPANLAAAFTQNQESAIPAELGVAESVTQLGSDGLAAAGQVVRAKAKVTFDSVRLKLVDERSQVQGQHFPVSGIRVKVAGTDFSEITDARGEVEIRDVPTGSRLLVEITDDRGYLMPQVTEIASDRDGIARTIPQPVRTRRFSSLDFIARSGGVVQDMRKSSLCTTVHDGSQAQADVSVALDVYANGPFYFNNLGLVDLRRTATSQNGLACFFNVEPGPVTISMSRRNDKAKLSGLLGLIPGRHSEESIDLAIAKHVTTTVTAVSSANEQLGSDISRANKRDVIEQADLFAVGSGHLMVSVEDGMFTTPSRVVPIKGRVWTVGTAQDFETVVQPITARSPLTRQISTLVPNGFVADMAVFANTTHDLNLGSVFVEHGHLSGHGTESIKYRLVDSTGRDVGDGWYFSDNPVTKAIFFNVPPGVYALIVETADGHWISADTTVVYSEAVSFIKTGSPLERIASSVGRPLRN